MQGNGGRVEVSLPVNARGVNKFLVLRDALRRLQVFAQKHADGLEVEIEDAIALRQQAGGFGRRLGAKENRDRQ
jgi:hypothetical protein